MTRNTQPDEVRAPPTPADSASTMRAVTQDRYGADARGKLVIGVPSDSAHIPAVGRPQ